MRLPTILATAAIGCALAVSAAAQPATGSTPEKQALARQLVEATGGARQMDAIMKSVFQSVGAGVGANLPPEQKRLQGIILQKVQERFSAIMPRMMDATVEVYAETLTEKELRDYLTWMQSETGRSVIAKLPQITAQSMKTMMPILTEVTQGIRQDVVDEVCTQAKCTPRDREAIMAAMSKSTPKQPS